LCLQVADFADFSLRYAPFEMTKEAFSDKLLAESVEIKRAAGWQVSLHEIANGCIEPVPHQQELYP